jgi:uncharacterized protein YcbX
MEGYVQSLWRHPIKGFTPERLTTAELVADACFPCDRLFAVEDGPSGFDTAAPVHISKQKFTVLAKIAAIARVRTRYDEVTGDLAADFDGKAPLRARLTEESGRRAFAAWLTEALDDEVSGRLNVLPAPGSHRFMDDPTGFVSIVNLASVADLSNKIGRALDPRRFRANLYVDHWPAWVENGASGGVLTLGGAEATVIKPIVRCVATHVDPDSGEKTIDVVRALYETYGHRYCGIYVKIVRGGRVSVGDEAVFGQRDGASKAP